MTRILVMLDNTCSGCLDSPRKVDKQVIKDFKTDLSGRTVIVTGAGRGIGRAIAGAFAVEGCRLGIMSLRKESIDNAKRELVALGAPVYAESFDVRDESACQRFVEKVAAEFGSIDILINNAGIYKTAAVGSHSSLVWHEIIDTNLNSVFYFSRPLVPLMKAQGWGRIINIASISGKQGEVHGAAYCASKFAVIGFTQSLALELAEWGVTVNAICPGWVDTDMARHELSDPEYLKSMQLSVLSSDEAVSGGGALGQNMTAMEIARLSIPQGRFLQAAEVAELAVYLAGERARGITGQAINICGGMCLS